MMNNNVSGRTNRQTVAALTAAAQAAANINAQLAAEGKIQQSSTSAQVMSHEALQLQSKEIGNNKRKPKPGRKDLFSAEVEINDLPPRVRNLLTKGYIQEQIQWKSKSALCTKGRYISPKDRGSASPDDRPLYVCIQAVDQMAVDQAIAQIHQFIAEHTSNGSSPSPPIKNPQVALPSIHHPPPQIIQLVKDKVYISLDHAPPEFKLVERVLGSGGDNVTFIQSETGVNVSLQGKGMADSSFQNDEPLHLLLEHSDPNAIQSARSLALSLVGTLAQDFVQWQREQQAAQHQQQQQQFIYTFSQPYYSGPGASTQYPTVATMVYSTGHVDQQQNNREAPPQPAPTAPNKRPSRFDYHQPAGLNHHHHGMSNEDQHQQHLLGKRPKLNHQHHPTSSSYH